MSARPGAERCLASRVVTVALVLAALAQFSCGDDDSPGGVALGGRKDSGPARDAAADAAADAEVEQPPFVPTKPIMDAGRDSGMTRPPDPPPQQDSSTTAPTCASLNCEAMSDPCNVVSCDAAKVVCVSTPRADGTACGSDARDNCSAPDECRAGRCEPRHAAQGTPCGLQDVDCQLNDVCDGEGRCIDQGVAPEGTACGEQTPIDADCDQPDSCDAAGVCQPHFQPAETPCGDHEVKCRFDDKCDGFGSCQDSGHWQTGSCPDGETDVVIGGSVKQVCLCGRAVQTQCHPEKDVCVEGSCVLGNLPDGTACGSGNDSECDNPDSCFAGACATNPVTVGTLCGPQVQSTSTCDAHDVCNGGGQCDPNYAGPQVPCGSAAGECAEAPHCSGAGACAPGARKPMGTDCGGAPGQCRKQRECSGADDACPAAAFADVGATCGNPIASDGQCDAPDSCDASGNCKTNNAPLDTPCGSNLATECSEPDSCNANGTCNPRHKNAGSDCGDQGLSCFHDDSCNGGGTCTDNGFDSPCPLSGTVTANNAGVAGVTVQVIGGNSTTTNGSGQFTLSVPLGVDVLVRVGDQPGYFGEVRARRFDSDDIGVPFDVALEPDASISEPAVGANPGFTVDSSKGAVFVFISGALTGDEGATLSTASDDSIAYYEDAYHYSDTLMSTADGLLFFFNASPAAGNLVTPVDGLTTECSHSAAGISAYPVFAHTVTWVDIECQ